jgi:hypothetical protein
MAHYCHQLQNFVIFDIGVTLASLTSGGGEVDTCVCPVSEHYQHSRFDPHGSSQQPMGGEDEEGRKGPSVDALQ